MARFGCGDNSCLLDGPEGPGTNGGCRCFSEITRVMGPGAVPYRKLAVDMHADIARLRALVKAAEWDDNGWCHHCSSHQSKGHASDCRAFHPDGTVR